MSQQDQQTTDPLATNASGSSSDAVSEMESELEALDAAEQRAEDFLDAAEQASDAMDDNLGALAQELAILKDALARSQAEQQNLIRRLDRERAEMGPYFASKSVAAMLPIVDDLERALAHVPEEHSAGVKSIHARMVKVLEGFGAKSFDSVGQELDTQYHEVMSQAPGEAGKVVAEFERGYVMGDKVVRHAKVIVGMG